MEFHEVVRRRRMVRSYTDQPVDAVVLDRVLDHAVRAPSAGFTQGWAFLVLERAEDVALFWDAATPPARAASPDRWLVGMRTAPVVVVPFACESAYRRRYAEPDKLRADGAATSWAVPYWHIDTGMATLLILQTAVDEGLGACFFGVPAERTDHLRTAFGVPDDHMPIGAVTLGHPDPASAVSGSARTRPRRNEEQTVHRGRWSV